VSPSVNKTPDCITLVALTLFCPLFVFSIIG
jgi:hypothetical protein